MLIQTNVGSIRGGSPLSLAPARTGSRDLPLKFWNPHYISVKTRHLKFGRYIKHKRF